jgi:hypothetical protein
LADQDIHHIMDEMGAYIEMFEPAFRRPEQLEWSENYLLGLLGDAPRKNVERIALELGENVSGMGIPIETTFEEAKGEVGFDYYEMSSWLGWHHHMLLVSLTHHFLVRLRIHFQDQVPALAVY